MGLINKQMPTEPMADEAPTAMGQGTPEQEAPVDGQDKPSGKTMSGVEKVLPPEMMEAFERTVLAGKKVMYSPNMEDTIRQELSGDGPIEKKLAQSVVGLMALLDKQAKPRIPVQVIVPATIELVYDAADFVNNAGLAEVTPEQLKTATQLAVMITLKRYGAPDDQIAQAMRGEIKQPPAAEPAQEMAPPEKEMPNG